MNEMGKAKWVIPGPDDPMFREGWRRFYPHWAYEKPAETPPKGPPLPTLCPFGSGDVRNEIGDDNNNFMFYACPKCYERVLAEYNAGKS
jgi:hypothetical protein